MKHPLVLGVAVGTVTFAMSLARNRTPRVISAIPDFLTAVVLLVSLSAAVWLYLRAASPGRLAAAFGGSAAIGATAGLVLGAAVAVLVLVRFSGAVLLSMFGFVTAFASVLMCAVAAGTFVWALRRPGA